jgi:zinc protease
LRSIHLLFLLLAVPAFARAADAVHDYTLGNGMRVIVKEDHRAPIVVSQVWYRVGSSYEPEGITGISHALEHMMFKGTTKHGPGEFSDIIAANGGEENAFTSRDYTVYHQTLSQDRLEIAFELEADRMRNLLLAPSEFAKEIEVVKEERRLRTEDRPNALTYEQFNAVAYRVLPYRNPVIGWMGDLERMSAADLKEWYRLWYAPNNATLVVVGDIQPDRVLALAKKHFGPLQAEATPRMRPLQEPPQRGVIRTVVRAPAREPYLMLGYHTPVTGSTAQEWEPYALLMLAGILDGGDSARLSRELVRGRELAVSAGAGYDPFSRFPEMLVLSGVPREGHTVAELETALREEIERLRKDLVSPEELDRVRAQVVAGEVYQLDSIDYQATQLGMLVSLGLDWRLLDQYVEHMKAVTAEQVREVARKYLTDDELVVATLEPLPIPQQQPTSRAAGPLQGGDDVR